jgi:DNA-damage-inducible protein D
MNGLKIFEEKKVCSFWNKEEEKWYFSVIDVIEILTGSSIPKRYWTDLKKKLTKEGSQLYEKIGQLKFEASDGKKYATDRLETQDLLRLIQSIPFPKAEPFKTWFAKVGYERIQEMA